MTDRWLRGWALGYAAVGGASLLVPLYALALGAGPALVGVLGATAAFTGVPGAVIWGRVAARTRRRRPFLLVALGLVTAVLAAVPAVGSPWLLVGMNAALQFVVAAAAPVLNLIVVDGRPASEWEAAIGRLNAVQGYGWVGGLVAGTAWTAVAPRMGLDPVAAQRTLFPVLAGASAAGFLLVRVDYPEPPTLSEDRFRRIYRGLGRAGWGSGRYLRTVSYDPQRIYWGLRTLRTDRVGEALDSPLRRYLLAAVCFSTGFAVFWGPMPAYLTGNGFASGTVFLLFLVANVGAAVTYTRVDDLSGRVGTGRAQGGALAARVILFPSVGLLGGLALAGPLLAVAFGLIGLTWAVIAVTTTALVTRLSPPEGRAEALGLQTALVGVGTGLGSAAGGAAAGALGYPPTFAVAGGLVLLGLLVLAATGVAGDVPARAPSG